MSPRVNWHCARGMTLASRHATLAIHQSAKLFDASMPAPVVSSLFDLHVAIRLPTHSVPRAPLSRFDHPHTRAGTCAWRVCVTGADAIDQFAIATRCQSTSGGSGVALSLRRSLRQHRRGNVLSRVPGRTYSCPNSPSVGRYCEASRMKCRIRRVATGYAIRTSRVSSFTSVTGASIQVLAR